MWKGGGMELGFFTAETPDPLPTHSQLITIHQSNHYQILIIRLDISKNPSILRFFDSNYLES